VGDDYNTTVESVNGISKGVDGWDIETVCRFVLEGRKISLSEKMESSAYDLPEATCSATQ
jgi:hypothetical protein